jgi:hypothetical protein
MPVRPPHEKIAASAAIEKFGPSAGCQNLKCVYVSTAIYKIPNSFPTKTSKAEDIPRMYGDFWTVRQSLTLAVSLLRQSGQLCIWKALQR